MSYRMLETAIELTEDTAYLYMTLEEIREAEGEYE
jgi:hypothetical protein